MTRGHGSAEQHKIARAMQCSVHERSTLMRLTHWQSWHGIFNHSTSPRLWRVERATPRVSTSSPDGGVSCRLLALLVVLACLGWIGPQHVSAATTDDGAA